MQFKRIIEEKIDLGKKINLENITIGEQNFSLGIRNDKGQLILSFEKDQTDEYIITIGNEGIGFKRHVYRPSHDHDDGESLQIATEKDTKKGELVWNTRFPCKEDGYDFFYVPFGAIKVDY